MLCICLVWKRIFVFLPNPSANQAEGIPFETSVPCCLDLRVSCGDVSFRRLKDIDSVPSGATFHDLIGPT